VTPHVVPETVEMVVEQDACGAPGASECSSGGAVIAVDVGRVTLYLPGAPSGVSSRAASRARSAHPVDLLWLTPAESEVLSRSRDIDATRGLGAAIAPLVLRVARADSAADRHRVATMVRGLLSAIAAERVLEDDGDWSSQQRLAVLAMQFVHSRLEDPELTSAMIARQLGVSLRTLQATFHRSPGPLAEWIRLLRLERTWIDIGASSADTPLDVSALGARWGFRSRDHFARAFLRHYGVHPQFAVVR
jgi:AraC-like DNA-binding protein